jgi:D-alanyl-D-alanine carboxypeptidase/D-alanyl-D-alanine-endopeptidase (penicillin-binding protein 4)
LKSIKGDIVGDESYFTGDNLGDGWAWNEAQWYYGAASSALSINRNQATVTIQNGKPKSDSKYVELSGEVKPVEDIEAIGLKRELGTNKVYVWGNGNNLNVKIAISDPALLSAKILKEVLEKNGIKVEGEAKSVNWESEDKPDVEDAFELASIESETLGETVHRMNKDSVNLYAELILRTLGKKFGNEAPDENPKMQKLRGDDSAGAAVIKKWLKDKNVATNEIAIHDGSGLSRLNNVTPEAIGRAIIYASNSKFTDTFKNSLPVAAQSGTLKGRLGNVSGKILGKTGSILYINSLAGFAQTKDETLAFVIIGNNITHKGNSAEVIDKIASILVKK